MTRDSFRRKPLPADMSFLDTQILMQSLKVTLMRTVKHRGGVIDFVYYNIKQTADAPRSSLRIKLAKGHDDDND